jgi:6,7-dimethyl-8-ribityllumazine synthase
VKASPRLAPSARGLRVAIVRSMFNGQVVDGLLAGAGQELLELGLAPEALTVVDVPGAFELPLATRAAAESGRFDAIVALGAVIRGETDHYEHIARAAAAGLAGVSVDWGVPVGFGVLTVADQTQALARSAPGPANKGAEAARAAVAMVHALRRIARGAKPARRRARRRTKGSS